MRFLKRSGGAASLFIAAALLLISGCVDQRGGDRPSADDSQKSEVVQESRSEQPRLIATSPAIVTMLDQLELTPVAICKSSADVPERFQELPRVGMPMNPDIEQIKRLSPDMVLSPDSLKNDLIKKYDAARVNYTFLNLRSVDGLYDAVAQLGRQYDRTAQADKMIADYRAFMDDFRTRNADKAKPKVLVLMGLPGAYIIATEHSYVGSLVKQAGGENVYTDVKKEFLTPNTEDMKLKEPDIILRAAHAMPEDVKAMFAKEFQENPIWRHFEAVKGGRVFDLDTERFNMSARFNYKDALTELESLFYGNSAER